MDYVYVRDSDQVVVGVYESALETTPSGVTRYEFPWKDTYPNYQWTKVKVIRNEDGTFTQTDVLHPDDDDGLI